MKATQWLAIAGLLLRRHYGIVAQDVDFDLGRAEDCLVDGVRPFQEVAIVAEKYDLDRIDDGGPFPAGALTAEDEMRVMDCVLIGEDPVNCPKCGSRSDFEEVPDDTEGRQLHECLNEACGHTFLCAPEDAAIAA